MHGAPGGSRTRSSVVGARHSGESTVPPQARLQRENGAPGGNRTHGWDYAQAASETAMSPLHHWSKVAENLGIEPSIRSKRTPAFQAGVAPCNTNSEVVGGEGVAPPSPEGSCFTDRHGLLTSRKPPDSWKNGAPGGSCTHNSAVWQNPVLRRARIRSGHRGVCLRQQCQREQATGRRRRAARGAWECWSRLQRRAKSEEAPGLSSGSLLWSRWVYDYKRLSLKSRNDGR